MVIRVAESNGAIPRVIVVPLFGNLQIDLLQAVAIEDDSCQFCPAEIVMVVGAVIFLHHPLDPMLGQGNGSQ